MFKSINNLLVAIDDFVWGVPLIVLILATGIFLTIRLSGLQFHKLGLAFKYMFQNDSDSKNGEVSSFAALCTSLSATIGTGNIVGVATAVVAVVPVHYSGCGLQLSLVLLPNMQNVCVHVSTVK